MLKILLIMSTFAPYNSCGSIPNTKLTKYLARQDVSLTLIASKITPDMVIDEKLLPAEMVRIRTFRVGNSRLFSKTWGATRKKVTSSGMKQKMKAETRPFRARLISMMKNLFYGCRTQDWLISGRRLVRQELKDEHFDVVFSSYPSYQAHLLAKYVMNKGLAGHWVADFRDPMGYVIFDKYEYRRSMRQQHHIEKLADHVTIVSKGAIEKFRFPDIPDSKLSYLPNGYDPEEFEAHPVPDEGSRRILRFFYAGSMYAGRRDLTVLFQAIRELADAGAVRPEEIRVEYAGNEFQVLQGYAAKYGLESICFDYGYVTRHRVMEIMSEIDATIVCSQNTATDRGVVTGKVFELLLIEKPILTVVTGELPDSELGAIIKDCSAGFVYEEATAGVDYPALKQWLRELCAEKQRSGKVTSSLDRSRREQYSYANIAKNLFTLFEGMNRC